MSKKAPQHIKLSDFGSARLLGDTQAKSQYTTRVGTPNCMQVFCRSLTSVKLLHRKFLTRNLILQKLMCTRLEFYLGVLLHKLTRLLSLIIRSVANFLVFYSYSLTAVFRYVCEGNRPPMPDGVPPKLHELVRVCWAANPDDRPDFLTVSDRLSEVLVTNSTS